MGAKLKSLTEKLKNVKQKLGKKSQLVIALILSLIMLIIFFDGIKASPKKEDQQPSKIEREEKTEDYVSSLETRLEKMLSSIKGINSAEAFIMTETSTEIIYAKNETKEESSLSGERTEITSSSEIVFSKDGSTSTPIVSVQIYPEIVGVLIVVDTKKDEKTRLMILNAVSVALGVNNSKIEVLLTGEA